MKKNLHALVLILIVVAVFGVWGVKQLVVHSAEESRGAGASSVVADGASENAMSSVRAQMEHLLEMAENNPDNPEILAALGNLYYDAGMAEKAVEYYDRVLAIEPKNTNILIDKATMLRPLGRSVEAVQILEQVVTLVPGHEHALFNLGVIYSTDLADPVSAITAWKQFIEAHPTAQHADAVRQEIARLESAASDN